MPIRPALPRRSSLKSSFLGCSAIAMAAAIGATPAVAQQQAAASSLEEIVVTGIRGSLQRAMDVKRNADSIVDAIASEDLGKFPDSNVAESLQRISGVSIDRSGGEGQFVTVRGFGPEFNTVLVNGRRIATDNPGREFSFDLLAAELISGAEVFKSSDISLQEGGIGSTINVKMARPLDFDGFKAVVSAKGMYESLSEKVAPQVFGFVSNTFADDKIGVLLSVSHQKRKARIDSVETRGFNRSDLVQAGLDDVFVPQNYNQIVTTEDRTRTGITGVVQFQAAPNFLITADGLYNRFNVQSTGNAIGHWFTASEILDADIDENRTVIRLDHSANGATDFITRVLDRPTHVKAAGLNFDWDANDSVKAVFDASWSRATKTGGSENSFTVIGFNNDSTYINDGSTDIPSITNINTLNGQPIDITDPARGRAHFVQRGTPGDLGDDENVTDEIFEFKFDTKWETNYEHFTGVKFGVVYSDQTKINQVFQTDPNKVCLYCGYQVDVPDSLLSPFDAGNGFLSGFSGDIPRVWQTFDPEAYFDFLESPEAAAAADIAFGRAPGTTAASLGSTGLSIQLQPDSFRVNEKIFAGYLQTSWEGDFGNVPWHANAGLRYVHTNTTARGRQLTLTDLLIIPSDET
ncbi:MAG: TonB-dependent receptor, partial [Alphaproteobacteria bacterium]